jgi:hypothetical protein
MKLEVVVQPVAGVERAKDFHGRLGLTSGALNQPVEVSNG